MKKQDLDSSASGYITDSFEGISHTFTDVEILSTSDVNVVAKAKRYGRWWLLKGLRKEVAGEAACLQRLRKEFEILMQMQHPSVVTAYGLETVEGIGYCIVMEFVDGSTLKDWLQGETTKQQRRRVADELTAAIGYVHAKGIAHRDLKPENIIVTRNGEGVKLIDFGLADTDSHAILKQPAGTPRYMSPEQMQGTIADGRNDIYSLGVIFQQMALGRPYRHIIKRCMLPIDERYQHVQALEEAISRRLSLARRWMVALLGLILIVTIGVIIVLAYRQRALNLQTRNQQQAVAMQQTTIERQRREIDTLRHHIDENKQEQTKQGAAMTALVGNVDAVTDYQERQQQQEEEQQDEAQSNDRMSSAFLAGADNLRKAVAEKGTSIDERYNRGKHAIECFMRTQTQNLTEKEKKEVRIRLQLKLDAFLRIWTNTEELLKSMKNEYKGTTTE